MVQKMLEEAKILVSDKCDSDTSSTTEATTGSPTTVNPLFSIANVKNIIDEIDNYYKNNLPSTVPDDIHQLLYFIDLRMGRIMSMEYKHNSENQRELAGS